MALVMRCDTCSRELRRDDWRELDSWIHACRPSGSVASALRSDALATEPDHDRHFDVTFCCVDCATSGLMLMGALEGV